MARSIGHWSNATQIRLYISIEAVDNISEEVGGRKVLTADSPAIPPPLLLERGAIRRHLPHDTGTEGTRATAVQPRLALLYLCARVFLSCRKQLKRARNRVGAAGVGEGDGTG